MRLDDNEGLPKWFMPLAALGVIWGLASAVFCYLSVSIDMEQLGAKLLPSLDTYGDISSEKATNAMKRITFEGARPLWAEAAYIITTAAGLAGAIGLFLKKKWSLPVLGVSLIGVFLVQIDAWLRGGFAVLSDKAMVISNRDMFIAFATTVIAAGLFYMAMQAWEKKWYK